MAQSFCRSVPKLAILLAVILSIFSGAEARQGSIIQWNSKKLLQTGAADRAASTAPLPSTSLTVTKIVYEDVDGDASLVSAHSYKGETAGTAYRPTRQLMSAIDDDKSAEVYEASPVSPAPAPKYKDFDDTKGKPAAQQSAAEVYEGGPASSAPAPAPKSPRATTDRANKPVVKHRIASAEVYEAGPVTPAYAPKYQEADDRKTKPAAQQSAAEVYEGAPVSPAKAPAPGKASDTETYEPARAN